VIIFPKIISNSFLFILKANFTHYTRLDIHTAKQPKALAGLQKAAADIQTT
jgi:hypothetical protein